MYFLFCNISSPNSSFWKIFLHKAVRKDHFSFIFKKNSASLISYDGDDDMMREHQTGAEALDRLAGIDLNKDGRIVNLIICGNSKFYDYSWLEEQLEQWVESNSYPDLIIIGGASGVDYLAERWANNNNIELAVFTEAWNAPRPNSAHDSGRPEAVATLARTMLERATHMLSFPGPDSIWTKRMEERAIEQGVPVTSVPLPVAGLE